MLSFIVVVVLLGVLFTGLQVFIRKFRVENFGNGSFATNPGGIKPKRGMIHDIAPDLYSYRLDWEQQKDNYRVRIFIARQLWLGASNPAVVVQENPTIIAAYAADCDAVLLHNAIENHKAQISEVLWDRAKTLGLKKLATSNLDEVRWGHPAYVETPKSYRQAIANAELYGIAS